jgi:DNA ligase-1
MKKDLFNRTMFKKDKKNSVRKWVISVRKKGGGVLIQKTYGLVGKKNTSSAEIINTGKNIGKANETDIIEQAILEAKSSIKKQYDRGYRYSIEDIQTLKLPSIVSDYNEKKVIYPCYVQPKRNGIRSLCLLQMLQNSEESEEFGIRPPRLLPKIEVTHISRRGNMFEYLSHMSDSIFKLIAKLPGLDGEIYTDRLTFQQIVSATKKLSHNTLKLEFHVFDIPDTTKTYAKRRKLLRTEYKKLSKKDKRIIRLVPTYVVNNEKELMEKFKDFIDGGSEGIIIRNKKGKYVFQFTTDDVQKYKGESPDSEFKIIGVKKDKQGGAIFVLKTERNNKFSAKIKGTKTYRRMLYKDRMNLLGKLLTVKYQNLSDDGTPIFPVGLAIRDYE